MRAFISYRREDSRLVAHLLADFLRSRLGRDNVFLDSEDVAAGEDIWPRISSEIRSADFLIALIGPNWRPDLLANTNDWVAKELTLAGSVGCPIIPTTHSGVEPKEMLNALPDSFEGLRGLNALEILDPPDHLSSFHSKLQSFLSQDDLALPAERRPLTGVRIGLSTSEPKSNKSLEEFGLARYTILHIAERLLDEGATLTYGGLPAPTTQSADWNITKQLRILARDFQGQIENYALERFVGSGERLVGGIRQIGHKPRPPLKGLSESAALAVSLNDLRIALRDRTNARVCLGGRSAGYSGRMPGVLEEVDLAMITGQPVFLLGGFGGVAKEISQIVDGDHPTTLRFDQQLASGGQEYSSLVEELSDTKYAVDYESITDKLSGGTAVLNNSLTLDQNELLMTTAKWRRASDLIIQSLKQIYPGGAAPTGEPVT